MLFSALRTPVKFHVVGHLLIQILADSPCCHIQIVSQENRVLCGTWQCDTGGATTVSTEATHSIDHVFGEILAEGAEFKWLMVILSMVLLTFSTFPLS